METSAKPLYSGCCRSPNPERFNKLRGRGGALYTPPWGWSMVLAHAPTDGARKREGVTESRHRGKAVLLSGINRAAIAPN